MAAEHGHPSSGLGSPDSGEAIPEPGPLSSPAGLQSIIPLGTSPLGWQEGAAATSAELQAEHPPHPQGVVAHGARGQQMSF